MKRDKLISKIERIVNVIEIEKDLPLDIKEIRVFGSLLYAKKNPDDADLLMIYERLTEEQVATQVHALEGYGTSLTQKMNRRLKANAEKIHIQYETDESLKHHAWPHYPVSLRIWSKSDRNWRLKLQLTQEEINGILLNENERFRALVNLYYDTAALYQLTLSKLTEGASISWSQAEKAKEEAEVLLRDRKMSVVIRWTAALREDK